MRCKIAYNVCNMIIGFQIQDLILQTKGVPSIYKSNSFKANGVWEYQTAEINLL